MGFEIYGKEANNPSIAFNLMNIGVVYQSKEEYDSAISYYEKSLKMKFEIYGIESNHQSIATNLTNLGSAYFNKGELDKAI